MFAQIGRLPVEQREVLILAAVEELRYDEIARLLGVPVGTVMSRLSPGKDSSGWPGCRRRRCRRSNESRTDPQ